MMYISHAHDFGAGVYTAFTKYQSDLQWAEKVKERVYGLQAVGNPYEHMLHLSEVIYRTSSNSQKPLR